MTVHAPPNTIPRVETLWAWLSVDPDNSNEGLCGALIDPGMWISLTTCSERMLPALEVAAARVAKLTGKSLRLVKFSTREDIKEIAP